MATLAPQIAQMGLMPGQIKNDVGAQRQAMAQSRINADVDQYNYDNNIGYDRSRAFFNDLMSNTGGYGTTTAPNPNQGNFLSGALGGAALGYGLYDNWNNQGGGNPFSNPGSGNGVNSMFSSSNWGDLW
jgi:hypothetical protein